MQINEEVQIKCIIVGDPGSGKTSLRRSFIGESFSTNYLQTIGSDFSYIKLDVEEKKKAIGLAIWDLAGQPEFRSVHSLFYRGAMAVIMVFDISNRKSFENLENWLSDFIEHTKITGLQILIVGNKIDLYDIAEDTVSNEEQVQLVEEFQKKYDFSFHSIQTSAKTGTNVISGIFEFSKKILDWIDNGQWLTKMQKYKVSKRAEINFPVAYFVAMHQSKGPVIIGHTDDTPYSHEKLQTFGVQLISSLNYDEIVANASVTGIFENSEVNEIMYYNAFTIENREARGNWELYLLIIHVNTTVREPLSKLQGIVEGFLHSAVNKFQKIRSTNNIDFIMDDDIHNSSHLDINEVLEDVRSNLNQSILNWLNLT